MDAAEGSAYWDGWELLEKKMAQRRKKAIREKYEDNRRKKQHRKWFIRGEGTQTAHVKKL
jgi:hypothetical protein